MRDRLARYGAFLCRHLSLIVIFLLTGALLSNEAARSYHEREAADYRSLWSKERLARQRLLIGERVANLEARLAALPRTKEPPREYQDRLAAVRFRFDHLLRGEGPVCPAVPIKAPPAPARTDAPPADVLKCPDFDRSKARQVSKDLKDLQAWVRAHTEGSAAPGVARSAAKSLPGGNYATRTP